MKHINAFFLLLFFSFSTFAQLSKIELGFKIGRANYLGDIQPKNFTLNQGNLAVGLNVKKNVSNKLAIGFSTAFTRIHASDSKSKSQEFIDRNLSFRSSIFEANSYLEYTLLSLGITNKKNDIRRYRFSPFVYGGIGLFHFNPKAKYQGNWVALQPLNTEGQGTRSSANTIAPYKLWQMNIPFGLGLKYAYSEKVTVAWDFGWRKTFTDYLDDVSSVYPDLSELAAENGNLARALSFRSNELSGNNSPLPIKGAVRGNPDNKDWYMTQTISINYKIRY